jgi:putative transposase
MKLKRSGVAHRARDEHKARHPVHITLRAVRTAGCLKAKKPFQRIRGANASGRIRVIHYSVQGNHLHLIVEAVAGIGLSRGMQGLNIRIARAINGLLHRSARSSASATTATTWRPRAKSRTRFAMSSKISGSTAASIFL